MNMAFRPKLTKPKTVKYSPSEEKIFLLIPRAPRQISMDALTHKFYDGNIRPGGQNTVSVMLNLLIKKVDYNKEAFKIVRTGRAGPHSSKVQIVARN